MASGGGANRDEGFLALPRPEPLQHDEGHREASPLHDADKIGMQTGQPQPVAIQERGAHRQLPEGGTRFSQTRTVVSAASAAWVAMPTWKLPVAVVVMRRLVSSQKTSAPAVMASEGCFVMSKTPWVAASMVPDDLLDALPQDDVEAVGGRASALMQPGQDAEGNSGAPSPSPETPAPIAVA